MQHGLVPDGDALANHQRLASVCMQHTGVLDVAVRANRDALGIATHHGAEPDAGARAYADLAHHLRAGGHPGLCVNLGGHTIEFINCHAGKSLLPRTPGAKRE